MSRPRLPKHNARTIGAILRIFGRPSRLARAIGRNDALVCRWRQDRRISSDGIERIASVLGCSAIALRYQLENGLPNLRDWTEPNG